MGVNHDVNQPTCHTWPTKAIIFAKSNIYSLMNSLRQKRGKST